MNQAVQYFCVGTFHSLRKSPNNSTICFKDFLKREGVLLSTRPRTLLNYSFKAHTDSNQRSIR